MIIPLPLVVSLLLAISYATEFKYDIDLGRCSKDTACFIRRSCLKTKSSDDPSKLILEEFAGEVDLLEKDNCNVVVQMKPFSSSKYLVLMRFETETPDSFMKDKGMAIKQNDAEQIVCKDGADPSGNAAAVDINKAGSEPNRIEASSMFCSFYLESTDKISSIAHYFETTTAFDAAKASFTYFESNGNEIKLVTNNKLVGHKFWSRPLEKLVCDFKTYPLKSEDSPDDDQYYKLEKADLSKSPIKCADSKKLLITHKGKQSIADELLCNEDSVTWSWGASPVTIEAMEEVEVACIVTQFCTMCADVLPVVPKPVCPDCKNPEMKKDDLGCKTLKCELDADGNTPQWTKDGKTSKPGDGSAICKRSGADSATGGWFITETEGGEYKEWDKLSCATIKPCILPTGQFKCEPEEVKKCYAPPKLANDNLTCADGGRLYLDVTERASIACTKGNFPPGKIYCADPLDPVVAKKVSQGNAGTVIGVVVGVIVVLCLVGTICYYFLVYKKKEGGQVKTKQPSKKGVPSSDGSNESKPGPPSSDPPAAGPSKSDP